MGIAIGFKDLPSDWEGPIGLKFTLHKEHSKTARYRCQLEKQKFDYYVPRFLLENFEDLPENIVVILGKSNGKMSGIGFYNEDQKPRISDKICEYDFEEEMGHSYKYSVNFDRQKYSLYVPKEIIQNSKNPERLFAQLAEFRDGENKEEAGAQITCPHCKETINLSVN